MIRALNIVIITHEQEEFISSSLMSMEVKLEVNEISMQVQVQIT